MTFSIDSLDVINRKIIIDFKNFNIQWGNGYFLKKLENKKILSKHEIEGILNVLIDSNFSNWKVKYVDEDIIDGLQWGIEYVIKQKQKRIYGSNKFPDKWNEFFNF
ncbi:MAG: hypothetical protein ACTH29_02980 [Fusobacterium sp.]